MYADDTQLYLSFPPSNFRDSISVVEACVKDVSNWMVLNKLKLNEDKTEVLLCNPKHLEIEDYVNEISICDDKVIFSKKVKNLGVYFDESLSMENQVNHLCKCLHFELRKIQHMSLFLDPASIKQLVISYMFSKLDYCNILLSNLPNELIDKLQKIQNHAARLVTKTNFRSQITPSLIKLHWLPVKSRLKYKCAVLCYKCVHCIAPPYLCNMLKMYIPTRNLRSKSKLQLCTKNPNYVRLGGRAFSTHGPSFWNSLPYELRSITTITRFKVELKTYLFKNSYNV